MATLEPATRSASRERRPSNNYSNRSPADNDKASIPNGGSIRSPDENRNPPTMPKGLGGMLKTSTETGDIGMFSIKPSRVPLPVNSPRRVFEPYNDDGMRRPRQFQPYGVPNIDDRRRLPSYARDASSEVISMYETASQKSASRVFDDPDYRSYSMTQTYSSYSLSNHRSYASLRSQPDAGGLVQRPRSPFAYPTRLKRPGFRPSSPALTDGGVIDYSRRAEIERAPYGANHHTSSPASLYAQKRKPQFSLRPEANRSTPSLLSQSSPNRRTPSPNAGHRSGTPNNDWQRRNGPASISTSPARSTFSLASTVNPYQTVHAPSSTTTPGRVPPPSPLYYDYTEDFDIDEYNQSQPLEPPPQFRVEKTIPEDRPLSSGWTSLTGLDMPAQKPTFYSVLRNSTSTAARLQKSHDSSQDSSMKLHTSVFDSTPGPSSHGPAVSMKDFAETAAGNSGDSKTIRLSGLGLGARELSSHVEEVFGLPPTSSFEVIVSNTSADEGQTERKNGFQEEINNETQSVRNSSYSLNTHIRRFPAPPRHLDGQYSEADTDQVSTLKSPTGSNLRLGDSVSPSNGGDKESAVPSTGHTVVGDAIRPFPPRSSSIRSDRQRLSRPYSSVTDKGLSELDELIKVFEEANRTKALGQKPQVEDSSYKVLPAVPSTLQNGSLSSNASSVQRFDSASFSFNKLRNDNGREEVHDLGLKRGHQRQRPRRLETVTVPTGSENDVPNFSHQFPRKLMSRSESPMLAPKPISPARQLKLKNSVPQLMKALPALPPDPSMRAVSPPPQLTLSEVELPCRFSPLLPDSKSTPSQDAPKTNPQKSQAFEPNASAGRVSESVGLDSVEPTAQIPAQVKGERKGPTPPPPPKLKLKMKSSSTLRSTSPSESRPWNSEDSYPWSSEPFNAGLPSVFQEENKPANPKPPKFKLKITRASNSTVGTVRVNRESGDSRHSAALHLRHPKDLFTPNSGIDNIFRQVSKHLQSRKPSASGSTRHPTGQRPEPISTPLADRISLTRSLSNSPQPSAMSLNGATAIEVRSFFSDDSSHCRVGGRNLGKRISNLRARIAVPYGAANGTQSHDDITWRSRNGQEASIPAASRSIPDLHNGRAGYEARRPRRMSERMHAQKLRKRFTLWFKGARSAIRARVKSRKAAARGDDEQLQLTAVV